MTKNNHSVKPYGNIIALLNGAYFDAMLDTQDFNSLDMNDDYVDYILMCCGA